MSLGGVHGGAALHLDEIRAFPVGASSCCTRMATSSASGTSCFRGALEPVGGREGQCAPSRDLWPLSAQSTHGPCWASPMPVRPLHQHVPFRRCRAGTVPKGTGRACFPFPID